MTGFDATHSILNQFADVLQCHSWRISTDCVNIVTLEVLEKMVEINAIFAQLKWPVFNKNYWFFYLR